MYESVSKGYQMLLYPIMYESVSKEYQMLLYPIMYESVSKVTRCCCKTENRILLFENIFTGN